jgi:hypothetical protein
MSRISRTNVRRCGRLTLKKSDQARNFKDVASGTLHMGADADGARRRRAGAASVGTSTRPPMPGARSAGARARLHRRGVGIGRERLYLATEPVSIGVAIFEPPARRSANAATVRRPAFEQAGWAVGGRDQLFRSETVPVPAESPAAPIPIRRNPRRLMRHRSAGRSDGRKRSRYAFAWDRGGSSRFSRSIGPLIQPTSRRIG